MGLPGIYTFIYKHMKSGSSIIVLRVFTYFQHYDKVIEKKANYSALTPLPNVGKSLTNRLPN